MDLSEIEEEYEHESRRKMKRPARERKMDIMGDDEHISWKKRSRKRSHRKKTWKDDFCDARDRGDKSS